MVSFTAANHLISVKNSAFIEIIWEVPITDNTLSEQISALLNEINNRGVHYCSFDGYQKHKAKGISALDRVYHKTYTLGKLAGVKSGVWIFSKVEGNYWYACVV